MSINKEIDEAICELARATENLTAAAVRLADASKAEVGAINAVNAAQKKLDALYGNLRKSAPRNTDWGRPERT